MPNFPCAKELVMPGTHADSMLRLILRGWIGGWIPAESEQPPQLCNKESELPRPSSDTFSSSPIPNGIRWHNAAQHFKCGRVPGASQQPSASARFEFSPCGRWKILYSLLIFFHRSFSKDIRRLSESSWSNSWIQIHLLASGYPKGQVRVCAPPRITNASTNVWDFCFYCDHGAIQGTRKLRQELTPVTRRGEMTFHRPAKCGRDSLYRDSVRAVPQHWIGATEIQPGNNDWQHWVKECTRH
jgi:hypothetical protein